MNINRYTFDKFASIYIFFFILIQLICYSEKLLLISNIVSISIVFIFFGYIFFYKVGSKIDFDSIFYLIFCYYAVLSSFWFAGIGMPAVQSYRPFILLPFLLYFFKSVLIWSSCRKMLFLSFVSINIINFFLYVSAFNPFDIFGITERGGRFQGPYDNPNIMSFISVTCMAMSLLYLLEEDLTKKIKSLCIVSLLFGFVLNVSSGSKRGVLLSLLLIIALLFIFRKAMYKNKKELLILFVLSAIPLYYFSSNEFMFFFEAIIERFDSFFVEIEGGAAQYDLSSSTGQRLYFIQSGLEYFYSSPIYGTGLMSFEYFHDGHYAHNNYIQILVNFGIIGFILFYSRYIYLFFLINSKGDTFNSKMILLIIMFTLLFSDFSAVTYSDKTSLYVFVSIIALLRPTKIKIVK